MSLESRAEIVKLARILGRDPAQFEYLEPLPAGDVRALRERATEVLWSANAGTLARLAAASKLLPSSLTATISERAFGPCCPRDWRGCSSPSAPPTSRPGFRPRSSPTSRSSSIRVVRAP